MRITSFTDYGLRVLMYLACLPEGQLSSIGEVSELYNASRNHMTKIIGQLRKSGYIEAQRGKGGGIRLAISPAKILIGYVIKELEFHNDGVDCKSTSCSLIPFCKLKGAISEAMDSFFATMNEYTLADFVKDKSVASHILHISNAQKYIKSPILNNVSEHT